MLSSFSRFNVADPPSNLPETIGSLSTAALPEQSWNEFWELISHLNTGCFHTYRKVIFLLFIAGLLVLILWLSLFLQSVGLYYLYVPMALGILLLVSCFVVYRRTQSLLKIQDICAKYSPIFESAGFRIEMKVEIPEDDRPSGRYIYFYPVGHDFQCIELAKSTFLGYSLTDHIPNAGSMVSRELWDRFWPAIKNDMAAHLRVLRTDFIAGKIMGTMYIALLMFMTMMSGVPKILWFIIFGFIFATSIVQMHCLLKQSKLTAAMLFETIEKYSTEFKQEGMELDFCNEYEFSLYCFQLFRNGHNHWRLYMFPMQASRDGVEREIENLQTTGIV